MSIRREEEMEMSDDDVEEMPTNKMTEESGMMSCSNKTFFSIFF